MARASAAWWKASIVALTLALQVGCQEKAKSEVEVAQPTQPQAKLAGFVLKATAKAVCERPSVDDFEDRDNQLSLFDDRGGYWYTYNDKNGTTLSPSPIGLASDGAQASKYAIRIFGKTGQDVDTFAGLGVPLSETQMPYDLSAASGICFRAKGIGTARVQLPDVNTYPEGGRCKKCYNSFGKDFQLTPDWQELCFRFDGMSQKPGWGEPAPALVEETVFGIQFQVGRHDMDYDLWLDDIRLSCE